MKNLRNQFRLMFLPMAIFSLTACEKEATETHGSNASFFCETVEEDGRTGGHTIGFYHNEILDHIITEFREVTTDNAADIYADIKTLTEGYYPGYEVFDFETFEGYRESYLIDSYLSMEDAIDGVDGAILFSTMAERLNSDGLITENEMNYYVDFGVDFYATENYDAASTVIDTYISNIATDESLGEEASLRLEQAFDIGVFSLNYWNDQSDLGIASPWGMISRLSGDRRPRWITALLKVGSDICGGAVGAGIGSLGGPVGTVAGGLAGGSAASALMWN